MTSGALLWRQGPGKVRNIFPFDGGVVTEMCDRGLYRRHQDTGALIGILKMSGIEVARRLGPDRLFAGPLRRRSFVCALPGLDIVSIVDEQQINPERCLSTIIREVSERDGELVVRGFEEYPAVITLYVETTTSNVVYAHDPPNVRRASVVPFARI